MKTTKLLFLLVVGIFSVTAYGGNEDKFIKKYAMMKIYESCFGPDVVKQIRKEMKMAVTKCAAMEAPIVSPTIIPTESPQKAENKKDTITHSPNNAVHEVHDNHENTVNPKPNFDPEKLHQAILAYRPNPFQPTFRPFPNTGFYPGFTNSGPMFFPGNNPGFQGGHMQFAPPLQHFPPFYQPQYFGSQRMAREMDIKSQLEALTNRMTSKVRNVTCVMQELGYLDENLEPNYPKIQAKIGSLPISEDLKHDIQDGVQFCQQFSQCVPDIKKEKSPLSNELIRPMFFFRCYKHKKLEACVMKDVRDRFHGEEEEEDQDLAEPVELRRTGKYRNFHDNTIDDFTSTVYQFLYGIDGIDTDSML